MMYKLIKKREDAAQLTDLMKMDFEYRYNVQKKYLAKHEKEQDDFSQYYASLLKERIFEIETNMYILGYEFQTQKKR